MRAVLARETVGADDVPWSGYYLSSNGDTHGTVLIKTGPNEQPSIVCSVY